MSFLLGWMCAEGMGCGKEVGYMGTSGNRDCQRASRSALKDFTDDFTISADSLFDEGGFHGEFQETMGNLENSYFGDRNTK